ncbi:hypothetical protein C8J56DRAFT_1045601 [Mycena floridula]|nr:hypothetical protein C8J56DRAFT_1045601 [Mycena floridula]
MRMVDDLAVYPRHALQVIEKANTNAGAVFKGLHSHSANPSIPTVVISDEEDAAMPEATIDDIHRGVRDPNGRDGNGTSEWRRIEHPTHTTISL